MSRAVRYQPGFNDFNDGPPNSGSAGFEFRANDKLNHGLWVSNSAHNGKDEMGFIFGFLCQVQC